MTRSLPDFRSLLRLDAAEGMISDLVKKLFLIVCKPFTGKEFDQISVDFEIGQFVWVKRIKVQGSGFRGSGFRVQGLEV